MMTNLAQTLARQPKRRHTFVFVAFDLEEQGLIGSRAYIQAVAGKHGVGIIATHDPFIHEHPLVSMLISLRGGRLERVTPP